MVFLLPVRLQSTQPSTKNLQAAQPSKPMAPIQPAKTSSFITTDKKAQVSGIRIEPEQGAGGFVGYADKGVSIVEPDMDVRVVLFGIHLDEIDIVGFTSTDNCSDAVLIDRNEFAIQSERRVVVIYHFASNSLYKLCVRQKPHPDYPHELPIHLTDEAHCWVSTNIPPRQYYFSMPLQIVIIAVLLVLSGLFSGLNLGLMSLTPQELTLIKNSGSPKERKYAQTILPVRKSGNRLLCSLLIGNVCVNSAISILFDDLTSGTVALIVSSTGIVVFGEIFPQALCVKKGLAVGACTIWVTRFFMMLTFIVSYPISLILDKLLGEQVESYDRKRLIELIKLNTKNAAQAEELKIAIGAFEMNDKIVKDVMTRIDDVFMLKQDTILNAKIVAEIVRSGYTRIPIFDGSRGNVVSLLFVKDLALLDPDDNFLVKTVCEYYQHPVRRVPDNTPLRTMLEEFKKGDYHMALVDRVVAPSTEDKESKYELVGLVTLEDIVEEILQAEIVDETDVVTDNVTKIKRRRQQRRDLELFIDDGEACQISMQMQLVTIQFLEGTFRRAFHTDRIAQAILEKVIRAHVHRVEVSHLADFNCPKTALPRKARLYVKKQPSDKFILILEGRAMVTIGQTEMKFEVGPWHFFGKELLQQLNQIIEGDPGNPPAASGAAVSGAASVVPAATTVVPIRTVTSAAGGIDRTVVDCRQQSQGTQQYPVADLSQEMLNKVFFIPDYSVNVLSECTYLEISVQTYVSMYKMTQITRTNAHAAGGLSLSGALNEQLPPPPPLRHRASLNQQQQPKQRKLSADQRRHSALVDGTGTDKQQKKQRRQTHGGRDEQQPLLISNGPKTGAKKKRKHVEKASRTGSNASTTSGGGGGSGAGLYNGVRTSATAVSSDEAGNCVSEDDDVDSHEDENEYVVNGSDDGGRTNNHIEDGQQQQQHEEDDGEASQRQIQSKGPSSDYLPFSSVLHH
ncbi:hypothetical protein niasHS_001555 [Heterodera schachtii]|uniref:Metal transporter CNNM2 n=1 Tax=Heterodera schachtii TaxID=97005 RepID=A0ABD2KEL2_HETSC